MVQLTPASVLSILLVEWCSSLPHGTVQLTSASMQKLPVSAGRMVQLTSVSDVAAHFRIRAETIVSDGAAHFRICAETIEVFRRIAERKLLQRA
jgi:hypothetical protein